MSRTPALDPAHVLDAQAYRALLDGLDQGYCILEVLVDGDGVPADYRFVEVNRAFERQTGLADAVGRTALELVPDLERHWIQVYGRVALTREPTRFEQGSEAMGRWFEVNALPVGPPEQRLVGLLFTDVTARRVQQEGRDRSERRLRASEARLRSFADAAPAMLWVTEPGGACSFLSRGWYDFTGQSASAGLGYGWLEAVHPGDRGLARELFTAANARRQAFELEHRLRRGDGVYRWVIDAGRPRFGADGAFAGFVGAVIDIHDRKVAEDRLDLAVNSGEVGLWYCDLPFDVLVWNPQVKAHFGLPADAVVTIDTFYERMHPEDRAPTRQAIDAAIASETPYDTQYRTVGLDGRVRWIRAIGRAHYEDGRPIRFDGITVDISELVALREAAESANRAKDEFLAMLSHELRNPLAPITTALQLLKLRGIDTGERERAIIERQVAHLVGLVDDLLDVSRITRGKIELRRAEVDVADVVARAVEVASPLLEQQRHVLHVDVPRHLIVHGDAARLAQVVANLLTNAAKYTEPGGTVTVVAAADGDDAVLRVRDTGVGIDAAMLPQVFDLFVQERQTLARSQGGLGLGLAIVRNLVELHGGTVAASSGGKGQGSEFAIRLPRLPVAPEERGGAEPPADERLAAPGQARVLVVDDNHDATLALEAILSAWGYDVRSAHDGPAALAVGDAFQPHIAVLDIGLPVMDGYELAERFAAHPTLRHAALVAVTGYGRERDRDAARSAGFVAHLVKPVEPERLKSILDALAAAAVAH